MKNSTVILDYGYGNIYSLKSALSRLGIESQNTRDVEKIKKANLIILPGVGSFKQAMTAIKNLKLDIAIKLALKNNSKILGICLGYQMLFAQSEEFGISQGLGIIKGKVKSLNKLNNKNERVPNVGWRPLIINKKNNVLNHNYNGKMVYFVHSFVPEVEEIEKVSTFIKFGDHIIHSSIHANNVVGFQYHPEKSGEVGLKIIKDTIDFLLK